jgi:uncharacterized DUF497 family protein
MEFEWHPDKAESNWRKHRIRFEDAARVFLDPNRIESFDGREAYGEDRWKTVGLVEPALLTVVYTVRGKNGDIIRLISARKADTHERAQYREIQA